ncbi:Protein of unknown function (DUF3505) domain containing protein, partial [Rhypophila decipiens]
MEPFVKLPEYPFVICKTCRYGCVANEVAMHLRKQHHEIKPSERSRIVKLVEEIPGIIPNKAGLSRFQFPPATTEPIPFIAAPEIDGIRCDECGFVIRTIRGIQGHCREEHGWENDWKRGGNVAKRARQERALLWTTGIHCQRFFLSRAAAVPIRVGYAVLFEVNRKEAHVKARKPFDSRMEDDTWVRYREVMRKLLCFIQRTEDWDDEARPPYTVTEK